MKCCINNFNTLIFTNDTKYIEEISTQLNFKDLEKSIEIIQEYKDKRVILDVDAEDLLRNSDYYDTLKMLFDAYSNIVVRLNRLFMGVSGKLKKLEIPFFFDKNFFADSFDQLEAICSFGVSDVYIKGEICFSMDKVRAIADKYNVLIRVIPNVAQFSNSSLIGLEEMDTLTSFWIRPGDLYLYENYIDVIEFFATPALQETYYEMYFTEIGYRGLLPIAIEELKVEIKNTSLPPEFTEYRINCGKRCRFNECHKCHKFAALAKLMEDNDLEVDKEGE